MNLGDCWRFETGSGNSDAAAREQLQAASERAAVLSLLPKISEERGRPFGGSSEVEPIHLQREEELYFY